MSGAPIQPSSGLTGLGGSTASGYSGGSVASGTTTTTAGSAYQPPGAAVAQSKMDTANDAVSFLKAQHQQIKALLEQVSSTHGQARCTAFFELRRLLAIHETAEEIVIHPESRSALPDGESVVNMRLQEEQEAKQVLCKLEGMDCNSSEFDVTFNSFKAKVIAHADAEEREEFDRLRGLIDAKRLQTLKGRLEMAEKLAPTHPHPATGESATGNMLAGPFASVVDRIRDGLSKAGGK